MPMVARFHTYSHTAMCVVSSVHDSTRRASPLTSSA
jgi:hypothetical protein